MTEVEVTGTVVAIRGRGDDCTVDVLIDSGRYRGHTLRLQPTAHAGDLPAVFEPGQRWSGTIKVPV